MNRMLMLLLAALVMTNAVAQEQDESVAAVQAPAAPTDDTGVDAAGATSAAASVPEKAADDTAEAAPDDSADDADDADLDEQTYDEDDDDFIPSEEIPTDEPIAFPSNI